MKIISFRWLMFSVLLELLLIAGISCTSAARFSKVTGHLLEEQWETLYPARHFFVVQATCLEVGTDLDVVNSSPEVQSEWGDKTDYLIDQFLRLYTSVANLIAHKKEARSYLLEDAQYLIDLMELTAQKYELLLASNPQVEANVLVCLTMLMHKSKQKVQELLRFNQEINLEAAPKNA
jgi:hypothetical protein